MKFIDLIVYWYLIFTILMRWHLKRLRSSLKRRIISSLPKVLKKQTLIVTLYLKGKNEKIFEEVNMKELNKCLLIANDPKALDYLVDINKEKDWYGFDFNHLLTKYNCDLDSRIDGDIVTQMSHDIVEKTPSWLLYDKREMIQDVSALLSKAPVSKMYSCPLA